MFFLNIKDTHYNEILVFHAVKKLSNSSETSNKTFKQCKLKKVCPK